MDQPLIKSEASGDPEHRGRYSVWGKDGMEKVLFALIGIAMTFSALAQADEDAEAVKYNLSQLLRSVSSMDQEPLSREELREVSDVIVNGIIHSITPGREYYHEDDLPNSRPLQTAIFEIAVNYAEKGFEGDILFFEYIVAGIPIEILDAVKPEQQIELFLRETSLDETKYRTVNSEGRTKGFGEHLYYPTRDIALIDQLPRDRKYDISALLRERGYERQFDQVDPEPSIRATSDSTTWDAEASYLPEMLRETLND